MIACAGTSDLPVAEEAAVTAEIMGNAVDRLYDVGVAGLTACCASTSACRRARVMIVVAGMEGALPSVVAGLVKVPVIAVPTSVGYGASFGGIAALLGMLNSCANGVAVVNIDNGFGAACMASANQSPLIDIEGHCGYLKRQIRTLCCSVPAEAVQRVAVVSDRAQPASPIRHSGLQGTRRRQESNVDYNPVAVPAND